MPRRVPEMREQWKREEPEMSEREEEFGGEGGRQMAGGRGAWEMEEWRGDNFDFLLFFVFFWVVQ